MEPMFECSCAAVRCAARAVTRAYDEALRPMQLRLTQFSILNKVDKEGQLALSELAERMVLDRTTMARNVKPLEREGWIKVSVGADRRERLLTITPAGKEVLERARPLWRAVSERFERTYGPDRVDALRSSMVEVVRVARDITTA
ncbi:MarR family winged helix-turn-helix transcriptional regulator [Duganella callida]|uniref:MarR family transcriptional regulator n=1 Tax=Duganella callida TaxID=2561932 RepID=A0A4Y9SJP9_9BURK|nr:MarR family transcriptional regulator [Duganella callida]TFW26545.1 MarR family transcriptional regulator [Duganella callida]